MESTDKTLESSGKDVDEAIANGLEKLGVSRADVEVTVLDEGSAGFLGLGSREALVSLAPIGAGTPSTGPISDEPVISEIHGSEVQIDPSVQTREPQAGDSAEAGPGEEEIAQEIVDRLLSKMDIEATTDLRQTEPDDLTGERRWIIDVQGEELGLLIGSRGETLNAFQYVARMMTGHLIHRRPNFIIDVEGYRLRREQALASLANRMASKATKRNRPITLEPMPPNERRIIHITLRDNDAVYTESTGEGQRRRVRIFPKSQADESISKMTKN
jgi:spoIIIJ-associated protein